MLQFSEGGAAPELVRLKGGADWLVLTDTEAAAAAAGAAAAAAAAAAAVAAAAHDAQAAAAARAALVALALAAGMDEELLDDMLEAVHSPTTASGLSNFHVTELVVRSVVADGRRGRCCRDAEGTGLS